MDTIVLDGKKVKGSFAGSKFIGTVVRTFMSKTINTEESVLLHVVKFDKPLAVNFSDERKKTGIVDHYQLEVVA